MKANHKKRIGKVLKKLKTFDKESAFFVTSASPTLKDRYQYNDYNQDSDFYYLTGSHAKHLALLINTKKNSVILFAPEKNPIMELWEGKTENFKTLAKNIGAELVIYKRHHSIEAFLDAMLGVQTLFLQNVKNETAWYVGEKILNIPIEARRRLPEKVIYTEEIMGPLRLIKEPYEIKETKEALKITWDSLLKTIPMLKPGTKEAHIAARLEYEFKLRGATQAFNCIPASGPSAATLHYEHYSRTLKKGEMFLLDYGARHNMYCADISRTFPVSGKFTPLQKDLYNVVLEAQIAAIRKVKAGVKVKTIYEAAAKVIIQGLIDFKLLKGSLSSNLKSGAFRKFFPHSIGHSLGIDTHDIGKIRNGPNASLKAGMLITIEPGIYFAKAIKKFPVSGIRIEDNILVTKTGGKNLSYFIPKSADDIEALFE